TGRLVRDRDGSGSRQRAAFERHAAVRVLRAQTNRTGRRSTAGDDETRGEIRRSSGIAADVHIADIEGAAIYSQRPTEIRVSAETPQRCRAAVNYHLTGSCTDQSCCGERTSGDQQSGIE